MFLKELKDLHEAATQQSRMLRDICDMLEIEATEASFEVDAVDATEATLFADGYQGKSFHVTLTLTGNKLEVVFSGKSPDGKEQVREYTWDIESAQRTADSIDSAAGDFLHNELEGDDGDEDEDDGNEEDYS